LSGVPEMTAFGVTKVVLLGVVCAVLSILFCICMHQSAAIYKKLIPNKYLCAAVGGLLVALLTLLVGTRDYNGAGMDVIARAIAGQAHPEAFALKILFTALTLGAGFKGGEIVPAFFTGATFGNVMGKLLGLSPSFGAGLGLVALFCGVTNCPISS
uniref:chloride channel protein n=1 Tax=Candidatus Fimivicinus sp. TaxID=3056640 RepID=UPI003FEE5FF7